MKITILCSAGFVGKVLLSKTLESEHEAKVCGTLGGER
jgi:putative NADH-flavin reductase